MVDEGFSFNPIPQEPFWFIAFPMVRANNHCKQVNQKGSNEQAFSLLFFHFFERFWDAIGSR
jgi:hypothetical protein